MALGRQSGYNKTGHTYEHGAYGSRIGQAYHRGRCETLLNAIEERYGRDEPLNILEVGCGTGMTLAFLSDLPVRHTLLGLDFSTTMLGYASQKAEVSPNPAHLMAGNAVGMPFADSSFDVVYATRFVHQFDPAGKKRFFEEVRRVLRPGGLVLLEFYAWFQFTLLFHAGKTDYPTYPEHLTHYPKNADVRDVVGASFRRIPLRYAGDRWINRLLGYRCFRFGHSLTSLLPFRFLIREYWVALVVSKGPGVSQGTESRASSLARSR